MKKNLCFVTIEPEYVGPLVIDGKLAGWDGKTFKNMDSNDVKAMIEEGDFYKIKSFIKARSFATIEDEALLLKRGVHDEIMEYISRYPLWLENEKFLIRRKNHVEILAYASRWRAGVLMQKFLLEHGTHEEVVACINVAPFYHILRVDLIKRGNHVEIMLYLSRYGLDKRESYSSAAIAALYERGNDEELALHISQCGIMIDMIDKVRERNVDFEIEAFRKQFGWFDEEEIELINRGMHKEIMAMLTDERLGYRHFVITNEKKPNILRYGLCVEAQLALAKRCSDTEIRAYMQRGWQFCREAEEVDCD